MNNSEFFFANYALNFCGLIADYLKGKHLNGRQGLFCLDATIEAIQ